MYDTILIGYDDSPQAKDSLTLALALAPAEADLGVFCVQHHETIAT
jgi:hypothetical protein